MRWLNRRRIENSSANEPNRSLSTLAVELATKDQPSFRSNPNWAGLPSPSISRLAAEADFRITEIGQHWERLNRELTGSLAESAAKYRRRCEVLVRSEAEQEQNTLAFEELIQSDSVSYDAHRRFEKKTNSWNLAHFGILVAFAIGEIPLNLLSLEALGVAGANRPVLWGAAGSIGLAILASAHFGGVYSKRLATDRLELGDANRSGAPKWARLAICVALVAVGVAAMWQLGSLRSQELTNAQVSEIVTARLNANAERGQSALLTNQDPVGEGTANAETTANLQDALLVLCEPTDEAEVVVDNVCATAKGDHLLRKSDPFGAVRWALLAVQASMYAIAFGIAFQSHDEILQQVKGQSEHLWWSKRKVKLARFRQERAEVQLSAALEIRKGYFAEFIERANTVVSDYEVAHWEYLRVVQGDEATPEASQIEPVGVTYPNWVRAEYESEAWGISVRDPAGCILTLHHPLNRFNKASLRPGSEATSQESSPVGKVCVDRSIPFEDLKYATATPASGQKSRSVIPRVYPVRRGGSV